MKKIISSVSVLILLICLCVPGFAEDAETAPDLSAVKLMVTAISLDSGFITPGEKSQISITVKNTSAVKSARNVKFTLKDPSGELVPDGLGTLYVSHIGAGAQYVWQTGLTAGVNAPEGVKTLVFSAEYEDLNYSSFSASDEISVEIRQSVSLLVTGADLPAQIIQGENFQLTLAFSNTSRGEIRNVTVSANIPHLSGGDAFTGVLPAAESAPAVLNFKAEKDFSGEISGEITVTYENVFGDAQTLSFPVASVITQKPEITASETNEKEQKFRLWWAFMLAGAVLGAAIGAGTVIIIKNEKQRREDEKRL